MKLTETQLLKLSPCRGGLEFARSCKFDFPLIYNTCERGNWLIWLLRKTVGLTKPQAVQIAIVCAEHVQDKFEEKYPDDKLPGAAIGAAKEWLKNPTDKNVSAAAAAAAAAAYAAAASAASARVTLDLIEIAKKAHG